ncbi:hypothetical protein X975_21131, partial [Stegodyphus mimosarum]
MGTDFNFVHDICNVTWLHVALVKHNHAGSSKSSVSTFSF